MGAELGATTSVFPSDERTRDYMRAQGRESDWMEVSAEPNAHYSEVIELDIEKIDPLIAQPHSPDNVVPVSTLSGCRVDQVCIGSCTNSSYLTMKAVASILKGKSISRGVSLLINPGSKQVYEMLSREGLMAEMIAAGARFLESACGPCIGMGGAPGTGQVSVRSYNRNFRGRSGNRDASVYLANPLSCAVFAVSGEIVDPRGAGLDIEVSGEPENYLVNDNMFIKPGEDTRGIEIVKGPNIKDVPVKEPLRDVIEAEVLLKLGEGITTDDIMPAGSKVLPYRSNIPAISEFVFSTIDETFSARAREARERGGGIIISGENYGQGSSREHAAIAPMYLGLQAVIAKSFARIHRSNLVNFGVLPLLFKSPSDYEKVVKKDRLRIKNVIASLFSGQIYEVENLTKGHTFEVRSSLNEREKKLVLKGGLLPYIKELSET